MEKVVKKYKLSEQPSDLEFWLTKTEAERLSALEVLREHYIQFKFNGEKQVFQKVLNKYSIK